MLSKEVSNTIFKVFGMTRPGIELRSPEPLANTLPIKPLGLILIVRNGSFEQFFPRLSIRDIASYHILSSFSFVFIFFAIISFLFFIFLLPSRLGLKNTPTASLQRGKTPPTSVLDMTLNNLMVRFQQCWSFGECGVPLHCHRSQVHSGPEW